MTEYNEEQASHSAEQQPEEEEKEEFKVYIGRVPTKFTEAIVKRILVEKLGGESDGDDDKAVVEKVELIYPHDDEDDENGKNNSNNNNNPDGYRADRTSNRESTTKDGREKDAEKEHRGFGFVSFATADIRDSALALGTIKGKRKKTSKKSHTMYVRPYVPISDTFDDDGDKNAEGGDGGENDSQANNTCTPATTTGRDVCYLWNLHRCPYGDGCKFRHVGEGGCTKQEKDLSLSEQKQLRRKRKGKCFTYKKKGKCPKGDDCPFSHDFEADTKTGGTEDDSGEKTTTSCTLVVPKTQKDCINWKKR